MTSVTAIRQSGADYLSRETAKLSNDLSAQLCPVWGTSPFRRQSQREKPEGPPGGTRVWVLRGALWLGLEWPEVGQ